MGALRRAAARGRPSLFRRGHQQPQIKELRANPRGHARAPRRATRRAQTEAGIARGAREVARPGRDTAQARRLGAPQHELLAPVGPEHGLAKLPDADRARPVPRPRRRQARARRRPRVSVRLRHRARIRPALGHDARRGEARFRARDRPHPRGAPRRSPACTSIISAPTSPATFKRLSGRYATRETELDTILRAQLFVDLHTIVRHR